MRNTLKDSFKAAAGMGKNAKNQFLEYERLQVDEMYAFTLNPVDQPVHSHPIGVKIWYENLCDFIKELKYCKVRLYIEVSKTGRFHGHGFLWVTDKLRFTIYDVPKIISKGSSKIDTMATPDDYVYWLIYCNKQQNEMNDYLTAHIYCDIDKRSLATRNPDGVICVSN